MMAKPLKAIEHQLLPDAESVYQLLNQAGPIQSFRPRGRQCQLISGQLQLQDVLLHSYGGSDSDFVVQPWGLVSVQATFSGTITVQDPTGVVKCCSGDVLLLPKGSGERLYSCRDSHSDVSLFIDPLAIRRVTAAMAGEGPESTADAPGAGGCDPAAGGLLAPTGAACRPPWASLPSCGSPQQSRL
jgi:hypothetical protein